MPAMKTSETFECDGSSTAFNCPFPALAATDVRGYRESLAGDVTPMVLNADYVVTLHSASTSVALTGAAPADGLLRFERRTALTDTADVRQLAYFVQELAADQERAAIVPRGEWLTELPPRARRARKLMAFDGNGDLIVLAGIDRQSAAWLQLMLADTTFDNTGAGMVRFDPSLDYERGTVGAALLHVMLRLNAIDGGSGS
jgi:hypothetical protein